MELVEPVLVGRGTAVSVAVLAMASTHSEAAVVKSVIAL